MKGIVLTSNNKNVEKRIKKKHAAIKTPKKLPWNILIM